MTQMTSFQSQRSIQQEDFKEHPDETSFTYKGYLCKIIRCRGHWCGYVMLTTKSRFNDLSTFGHYNVHGGITYVNPIDENKTMIGFDCGHSGDFTDSDEIYAKYYHDEVFRTFDYTHSQIWELVGQIIEEDIYKP